LKHPVVYEYLIHFICKFVSGNSSLKVRPLKSQSNTNSKYCNMKKSTLFMLALCISVMAVAQTKYARVPVQSAPARAIKNQQVATQPVNPVANSKSVQEFTIGDSQYDMQTNASMGPRHKVYPDGTMAGTWIRGFDSPGRGSGYNYYDGSAWGAIPTARIENDRTGWPSYAQLGTAGEIVVAHLNDGLKISTRAVRGTGSWTESVLMGPTGATDLSWPRMITNGATYNNVHILATSYELFQGLNYALFYYRSLDGGATWDKSAVILPQLTSADYDGFNGDEYEWGTPHGDTIYFAVSGPWVDTFIMKSNDNGETWTKIPVLSNANRKLATGVTEVKPFASSDGSVAVEMDNTGILHMAFGIGGGYMAASTKYIYINKNGLVYWNSTMPMVKDSLVLDTLAAHGQLLGYVSDGPNPGDTIIGAPSYRVGLASFPQISVDAYNNKYFLWSAVSPGNPSPDPLNYRHLNGRAWFAGKANMTPITDLNSGFQYIFTEFVYPAMAKYVRNNNLSVIYQTSNQPGSNIVSTTISVHTVNIDDRIIPVSTFWPTSVGDHGVQTGNQVSQNYPNPACAVTHFRISLVSPCDVTLSVSGITGIRVMEISKGMMTAGSHDLTLDTSQLAPGIYLYTVTMGTDKVTRKMVVQ